MYCTDQTIITIDLFQATVLTHPWCTSSFFSSRRRCNTSRCLLKDNHLEQLSMTIWNCSEIPYRGWKVKGCSLVPLASLQSAESRRSHSLSRSSLLSSYSLCHLSLFPGFLLFQFSLYNLKIGSSSSLCKMKR